MRSIAIYIAHSAADKVYLYPNTKKVVMRFALMTTFLLVIFDIYNVRITNVRITKLKVSVKPYPNSQSINENSAKYTNTRATDDDSVIRMLNDGPAVSLNGSPTVSPITVAL